MLLPFPNLNILDMIFIDVQHPLSPVGIVDRWYSGKRNLTHESVNKGKILKISIEV